MAAHAVEHGSACMPPGPVWHLAVEGCLLRQADGVAAGVDQQEIVLVFAPRQASAHAAAGGSVEPGAEVELVFD
jgi:hypothetical protein